MPRLLPASLILYLILLWALDACLIPVLGLGPFKPLMMVLLVLYSAFEWRPEKTFTLAASVGLLRDLTGTHPLGVETIAFSASSVAMIFLLQKVERSFWVTRFLLTFLFVGVVSMVSLILFVFLNPNGVPSVYPFLHIVASSLATALAMPFFFLITRMFFHDPAPLKQYELFR